MTPDFSPERSSAIRESLIEQVAQDTRRGLSGARRWLAGTLLVIVGAGAGAGVSAAAFAATSGTTPQFIHPSGQPSPDLGDAVPAPPGVLPGQPIISMLGDPLSRISHGTTSILLPPRPAGATHLRVSITCLTPGTTQWGTDGGIDSNSVTCDDDDLGQYGGGYYDFPLDGTVTSLELGASDKVSVAITFQYANYVPTALGVNESGQTYGVQTGFGPTPDLLAVSGIAPDGPAVEGYVVTSKLFDFGPDWPGQPSGPAEALAWQRERDAKYPNGWDLPVYESDGTTRIGLFHVGV